MHDAIIVCMPPPHAQALATSRGFTSLGLLLLVVIPIVVIVVFIFIVSHQSPQTSAASKPELSTSAPSISKLYAKPELVTIEGYTGPQEDPVISPDGEYLFFDSHNDAGIPSRLYYAKRIDYKTFQYMGKVQGTDHYGKQQLEGVEDSAHNFYFISGDSSGSHIRRGMFVNGSVTNAEAIKGISSLPAAAGAIAANFDLFVTPDGNTLYFAETEAARLWAMDVLAPGEVQREPWPSIHGGRLVGCPGGYQRFDSMAVDGAGNICVATLINGGITVFSPDGLSVKHMPMPDLYATNICFGGPDLRTAYVTLSGSGRLVAFECEQPGLRLNWQ